MHQQLLYGNDMEDLGLRELQRTNGEEKVIEVRTDGMSMFVRG